MGKREAGILMPIFSIIGEYGIGDFGKESYKFIDKLCLAGVKTWQILPLVQTGYGNSPYSSISYNSINPYFIAPDVLLKKGLITKKEAQFSKVNVGTIDYHNLYTVRFPLLEKAFSRFDRNDQSFIKFVKSKKAYNYALFMALKYASGQKNFYNWQDQYKYRNKSALAKFSKEYSEQILFWQFVQYEGLSQWLALKKYANSKGITILGDMPLYVALDSVDVWENPNLYKLDENYMPKKVAGVPPDYFCEDGQLWGNPVYDYEEHKKDNFKWWTNRLKEMLRLYDYVRIDHFRALDRYYEIESNAVNAKEGEWIKVPSDELFNAIHSKIDRKRIIAEDLGIIDDGVRELLKKTGYPGMKILSFAFNGEENNLYLPERIEYNSITYTGTHDNDTLKGLIENSSEWDYRNLVNGVNKSLEKMNLKMDVSTTEGLIKAIIALGLKCESKLFIIPMQDVLMLDEKYRINTPGTVKEENWATTIDKSMLKNNVFIELGKQIKKYGR